MDDQHLVARLLDGDPQTVELMRSWIRAASTPYRKRLAANLEDLEQEILLQLIEALRDGRFQGRSRLKTYVKTYVHHKSIDRLRAARRREWVGLDDLDLPSGEASALEKLARSESVSIALRVLGEMPASCRELWNMIREGLSYREMSQRLEIAEGTLRARVLRCRRRALKNRAKILEDRS